MFELPSPTQTNATHCMLPVYRHEPFTKQVVWPKQKKSKFFYHVSIQFITGGKQLLLKAWPHCHRPSDGVWWWGTWRQPPSWCWWSFQTVCQPAEGCWHSSHLCTESSLSEEEEERGDGVRWGRKKKKNQWASVVLRRSMYSTSENTHVYFSVKADFYWVASSFSFLFHLITPCWPQSIKYRRAGEPEFR